MAFLKHIYTIWLFFTFFCHSGLAQFVQEVTFSCQNNPFFSKSAGSVEKNTLQWHALNIIESAPSSDIPSLIKEISKSKKKSFPTPIFPEPPHHREFITLIRTATDESRLLAALEFALSTFISPDFDQELRKLIFEFFFRINPLCPSTEKVLKTVSRKLNIVEKQEREVAKAILSKRLQSRKGLSVSPLLDELAFPPQDAWLLKKRKPATFPKTLISDHESNESRWNKIKTTPLRALSAAPGHQSLRNPTMIQSIAQQMKTGSFHSGGEKLIVNIVTNPLHELISIDIWDGHHRLAAYVLNGLESLNDLSLSEFEILVNGFTSFGTQWTRIVPEAGLDLSYSSLWTELDDDSAKNRFRLDTIRGEAHLAANSNFTLGSVYSLGDIVESNTRKIPYRIGVYYSKADEEIPNPATRRFFQQKGVRELVTIPNPDQKYHLIPIAILIKKIEQLNESHSLDSLFFNFYRGDSIEKQSQLRRIQQIYATTDPIITLPE